MKSSPSSIYSNPFILLLCVLGLLSGCNWVGLASVSSSGEVADRGAGSPSLSVDGRYIAFDSGATNLVPNDITGEQDIFVRDLREGVTNRISVSATAGIEANSHSYVPKISGDGQYVAFFSHADNLVDDDTNDTTDVFVHDRESGMTSLVSVNSSGIQGNRQNESPSISADGRFVSFTSTSTNLTDNDTNATWDVFVHDRETGETRCVSVNELGDVGNLGSGVSFMAGNGRYVAFSSSARNFANNNSSTWGHVYVYDLEEGTNTRVSVDTNGIRANATSSWPAISSDGRYIAFHSVATNLVNGDNNGRQDVFVYDRLTETTEIISVNSDGSQGNGDSNFPSISGNGRYVTFSSRAYNLVADDTNFREDIFIHDRVNGTTTRASLDALEQEGNSDSFAAQISADGRYVAFGTDATNLILGGVNSEDGVVVRAVPHVTVSAVVPDVLPIGTTSPVTISGTNFLPGATPYLNGAQLSNIVIADENTITMDITVLADTPSGVQDVSVGLPGTGPGFLTGVVGTCTDCVTIPPGC